MATLDELLTQAQGSKSASTPTTLDTLLTAAKAGTPYSDTNPAPVKAPAPVKLSLGTIIKNSTVDAFKQLGGAIVDDFKTIPESFTSGIQQANTGAAAANSKTATATTKTEGILNFGAGLVTAATAPLAPAYNFIPQAIKYAAGGLEQTPYIQNTARDLNYAGSAPSTPERILQAIQNISTIGTAALGAHEMLRGTPAEIKPEVPTETASTEPPGPAGPSGESPATHSESQVSPIQRSDLPPVEGSKSVPLGSGVTKVSKLAADIADTLEKQHEGLPTYETTPGFMKDQADKALNLMNTDPTYASDIAMGKRPPPQGLREGSVFTAMETKAKASGDYQTLDDLSRSPLASEASMLGQRVKAFDSGENSTSPVKAIREVRQARATPRAQEEASRVSARVQTAIRRQNTPKSWGDFVKSIEC